MPSLRSGATEEEVVVNIDDEVKLNTRARRTRQRTRGGAAAAGAAGGAEEDAAAAAAAALERTGSGAVSISRRGGRRSSSSANGDDDSSRCAPPPFSLGWAPAGVSNAAGTCRLAAVSAVARRSPCRGRERASGSWCPRYPTPPPPGARARAARSWSRSAAVHRWSCRCSGRGWRSCRPCASSSSPSSPLSRANSMAIGGRDWGRNRRRRARCLLLLHRPSPRGMAKATARRRCGRCRSTRTCSAPGWRGCTPAAPG
jgi:hypothetical protein